jgi:hypothetical protein
MLRDFNAEVCREDIFKPTVGNESLHRISIRPGQHIAILTIWWREKLGRDWQ